MRKEIIELIKQIIKDSDENKLLIEISGKTTFKEIGLSSFDLATLTVEIEDRYDVDIFENKIISNIGEIFELLEK